MQLWNITILQQAEALEALEAIKWVKEAQVMHLCLKGDNLNVVKPINSSIGYVKWTTNGVNLDGKQLFFYFF